MNCHDRGVFSNFEQARSARSRIDENIEVVIFFLPAEWGICFTVCLMRHLILARAWEHVEHSECKVRSPRPDAADGALVKGFNIPISRDNMKL